MLTRGKVAELKKNSQYKDFSKAKINKIITFAECADECRQYISKAMPKQLRYIKDPRKQKEETIKYLFQYVDKVCPNVKGYANLRDLKEHLVNEITEYGILTELIEDPDVDEIQVNSIDQIFYEKHGRRIHYKKKFENEEQFERIIRKFLSNAKDRLTPVTPFVNARTTERYRVNAIDPEISGKGHYGLVLRKFKQVKLSSEDLIKMGAMSKGMYELLALIPRAGLSWITAGETGSGKTTTNELFARMIPEDERIITIENPPEYHLDKIENGWVKNNVLSLEATSKSNATDKDPTMENLIVNAMRQSPDWIAPGELRSAEEFRVALIAAQTGHKFFTTMHASSGEDVIDRYLTAYCSVSREPAELALRNICKAINFIVSQKRLKDGTRKIIGIYEVVGSKGLKPVLTTIYRYVVDDVVENSDGTIKFIGRHKRVGKISKELQERLLEEGVGRKHFERFVKEIDANEVEDYFE